MATSATVAKPVTAQPLSADAQHWTTLSLLYAHVQSHVERQLTLRAHLRFSEFTALRALAEADNGELRIQVLADLVSLDQSSTSRLVARLQEAGLTERRHCAYDKRGVYIGINAVGRRSLDAATEVFEAALHQGLKSVPDPTAGKKLRKALSAMRAS